MSDQLTYSEREMLRILAAKESGQAYQTYEIEGEGNQWCVVCETNDDDDDGYPDGMVHPVRWVEHNYGSVMQALKRTGVSRFGISGVAVIVTVNGQNVLLGDDFS